MRKIAFLLAAALSVGLGTGFAADGDNSVADAADSARLVAERRMKKFGGFVYDRRRQKGRVLVLDAQKSVSASSVRRPTEYLASSFEVAVEYKTLDAAPSVANAESCLVGFEANAGIFVVDDASLPMSLVAAEARWAFVNVRPLMKDKPSADLLAKRVSQQIWRAFGNLLGASDSRFKGCIMSPISSVSDLDRCQASVFSPEPFERITSHLKAIGVTPAIRATYRRACQEGWAPAPTNEHQKAVWDKVHALPKNPMKIEFDPKKGR